MENFCFKGEAPLILAAFIPRAITQRLACQTSNACHTLDTPAERQQAALCPDVRRLIYGAGLGWMKRCEDATCSASCGQVEGAWLGRKTNPFR